MKADAMNPITEDDIANYLANTPDFFTRHAQLLASVQLTSPHGNRAVSLQERQAEMLREKIKALEHRLMDMMRHGNENVVIADRLHRWARKLFEVQSDARSAGHHRHGNPQPVHRAAGRDQGLGRGRPLRRRKRSPQGVSEDAKTFASSLTQPYCGVNSGFEAVNWLDDTAMAMSLALIPLRERPVNSTGPAFGMLVLASPDPQRFQSGMGTDFLERIAELASAALSQAAREIASRSRHGTRRALPGARAGRKASGGAHGRALRARPAKTFGQRERGRRRTHAGAERARAPLGGADARRRPQRPRHRADPVGLARLLRLAGAPGPGGQQPGAGRARTQGAQALAQGLERGRFGATGRATRTPMPTRGSRRATPPWSNCCTAAACAWANWSGWTRRRARRRAAGSTCEAGEAHVLGKGSKRRTVPVGSKALEALARWLAVREQRTWQTAGGPLHRPPRHATDARRRSGSD